MIKVGIIGYGYWGPNLVRNFVACDETEVTMVCDRDAVRLGKLHSLYPAIRTTARLWLVRVKPTICSGITLRPSARSRKPIASL